MYKIINFKSNIKESFIIIKESTHLVMFKRRYINKTKNQSLKFESNRPKQTEVYRSPIPF